MMKRETQKPATPQPREHEPDRRPANVNWGRVEALFGTEEEWLRKNAKAQAQTTAKAKRS